MAKALERQLALWSQQYVIVTEESTSRKDRIPYVCSQYGIDSINILSLFQREKWEFVAKNEQFDKALQIHYFDKIQEKVQLLQTLQQETEKEIEILREGNLYKTFRGEF